MRFPHAAAAVSCHFSALQGLLQLFAENGVVIPLHKCGPCQYRLGSAKLAVRLVNGRLMARAGGWWATCSCALLPVARFENAPTGCCCLPAAAASKHTE
jgi:hypothetical protein